MKVALPPRGEMPPTNTARARPVDTATDAVAMTDQAEKLAMFKAVSGTEDDGFAISFLEAHDWNVETAVNSLMGGGAAGGSPSAPDGSPSMLPGMLTDEPTDPLLDRAPISQYKDTLMDPAQRMPTTPAAPVTHRLALALALTRTLSLTLTPYP